MKNTKNINQATLVNDAILKEIGAAEDAKMGNEEIIGKSTPIRDASLKVTGEMKYVADMKMPRMLVGKVLFSPYAHAHIRAIDTSEAEKLPGVHAVVCYKNVPDYRYNSCLRFFEDDAPRTEQVFSDTMRFIGDRVAAVAADDEKTALTALKLIKVDYEVLPAVFDPEKALEAGAPPIHEGGNKLGEVFTESGNVDEAFKLCDRVFEDRYDMPAIHHVAIETHTAIANYDARGKLTIWTPTQNAFNLRILLYKIFSLPMNRIRVIRPAIGGGFGAKVELNLEGVVAALALKARRPVKLVYNRRETMISSRTRHAAVVYMKTGVMKDGTILAQDFRVITNTGGYASSGLDVLGAAAQKVFKVYRIPHMRFLGIPAFTNTPIAGAMRGYGSPQVFNAQQAQLRKIARELGMDLVDLQLKNIVKPDGIDQRWQSPIGNPRVEDAILHGAELFNWTQRKKDMDIPLEGGWKRGIGMAIGAHGSTLFGAHRDIAAISMKANPDGTFIYYTGAQDMGNGSITTQTMIIADILGIRPEDIDAIESDTDLVPYNLADYASRGVYVEAAAAKKGAESMRAKLAEKAAKFLECQADEVEFKNRSVYVRDCPQRTMAVSDVIQQTQIVDQEEISIFESYHSTFAPTSYGVHFAEVWVNEALHQVKVMDYVAVHDVGKVLNPMGIQGQVQGGIAMGIGYALSEGLFFDENGNLINDNLKDYVCPHASDMPAHIKIDFLEKIEPSGPYGAKSIGECATVPGAPAIFNAVCNALNRDFHSFPIKI